MTPAQKARELVYRDRLARGQILPWGFDLVERTRHAANGDARRVLSLTWLGTGIAAFPAGETVREQVAEYVRVYGYLADWNARWNAGKAPNWTGDPIPPVMRNSAVFRDGPEPGDFFP